MLIKINALRKCRRSSSSNNNTLQKVDLCKLIHFSVTNLPHVVRLGFCIFIPISLQMPQGVDGADTGQIRGSQGSCLIVIHYEI